MGCYIGYWAYTLKAILFQNDGLENKSFVPKLVIKTPGIFLIPQYSSNNNLAPVVFWNSGSVKCNILEFVFGRSNLQVYQIL